MNINLNLYKYFYEVAKAKSYTEAANNLYVSQPSLSYSVKTLEEQLGYKLFNKSNNRIELTEEGKKLFNSLKNVFSILENSSIDSKKESKTIKIGILALLGTKILPKILHDFYTIYPNIEIEYYSGDYEYIYNLLINHEVDFIITEKIYDDLCYTILDIDTNPCFVTSTNNSIGKVTIDILKNKGLSIVEPIEYCRDFMEKYNDINYKKYKRTPIMIYNIISSDEIGLSSKLLVKDSIDSNEIKVLDTDIDLPKAFAKITYKNSASVENNELFKFLKDYKY